MAADVAEIEPRSPDSFAPRGLAFTVGFFFSFRLSIVLISVRLLGLDPSIGSAVSLCVDFLLLTTLCFATMGACQRAGDFIWRLPGVRWGGVFLALSGVSLLWSETASKANSLAYWLGLVIDVGIVILLLRGDSEAENANSMMRGFIWCSCILAAVAWLMPAQSDLRLGDPDFFNTNEIGNLCAFAIFFAQYLTRTRQEPWRLAKFLLLVTLVRSLSKTTLIAFLISQSFLLVRDRSTSRKAKVILLASALALVLVFWGLFEAYYDVYSNAGNQTETLTGRTAIWLYVFGAIQDHPWTLWIGHGFDSWWKVVPPFGSELFEARHAENEFLQQFYAYGALGIAVLGAIYASLYRQVRRLQRSSAKILFLCILGFILVRGLAEADAFDLLLPIWAVVLLSFLIERAHAAEASRPVVPLDHSPTAEVRPRFPRMNRRESAM